MSESIHRKTMKKIKENKWKKDRKKGEERTYEGIFTECVIIWMWKIGFYLKVIRK